MKNLILVTTVMGMATLTCALSVSAQPFLVAGWDTYSGDGFGTYNAPVAASGISASFVLASEGIAWHVQDGRGASNDGTWGSVAIPPTASTVAGEGVTNENLELSNATTGGTITFTITNNGSSDIELSSFHFDSYAFRPKAARAYELSVLAGGAISAGVLYTSVDDEITSVAGAWNNGAHDDIDHAITGADTTLEVGGTVQFLLAFSSGVGDGSGGHDLWVDNIAIASGVELLTPGDFDGDGDVDGADFLEWQRNDVTPAGLTDWQNNYGTPLQALAVSVPEPSSVALILLAAGACLLRRAVGVRAS